METVVVETNGPVWTITLNRPEVRNAVDGPTARALTAALRRFDADADACVAVLTGAGGHFCAGADLRTVAASAPGGPAAAYQERTADDLAAVAQARTADEPAAAARALALEADMQRDGPMGPSRLQLGKPVIAAVSGYAVAGGLELALWCDLRVVDATAVFGVFCRRWGVPLIDGGTVRLPRLIGESRALDLILTGRPVDADEALAIGLANRRAAPGQSALAAAQALAQELSALPQTCLRSDRASAKGQWSLTEGAALAREFELGLATIASGETARGAARFAAGAGRHGQRG